MRGKIALGIACGLELSAMVHRASADVLYRQNFAANSGAGMAALTSVNWNPYFGSASTPATLAPTGSSTSLTTAMISGGASAPTPGPNVNAATMTGVTSGTTYGFVPLLAPSGAPGGTQQFVVYTSEYTINTSSETPTTFSWYAATGFSASDSQTLVVQVDGNWYASTYQITGMTTIGTSGNNFGANAVQYTTTFSTAPSAWQTLNFSPGTDLTLGSVLTSPLPSGNITAFGIYADLVSNASARTYFDTFEVDGTAVPEPAGIVLAAMGAAPLLSRRRRRT